MLMGILENIREKVGSKVHEYNEGRARDKAEYQEHYNKEFESSRKREIENKARERAKQDAHNQVHPMERINKGVERIGKFGGDMNARGSGGSLGRNVSSLGDFGRSIGHKYDNMQTPSWMKDFDKPKRNRGKNPLLP